MPDALPSRAVFRIALLATGLVLLCSPGCSPPRGMAWEHDSEGLFIVTEKGGLVRYSLRREASKSIHQSEQRELILPAIHPDPKQKILAVADFSVHWEAGKTGQEWECRISFLDYDGQLQKTSRTYKAPGDALLAGVGGDGKPAEKTDSKPIPCALWWSASGEKILMFPNLIYDVPSDSWDRAAGTMILPVVNPLTPDGKGFLAVTGKPEKLVFIDWEGWKKKFQGEEDLSGDGMLYTQWSGDAFQLIGNGQLAEYNLSTMKCTVAKTTPLIELDDDESLAGYHRFKSTQLAICLIVTKVSESKSRWRIEQHRDGRSRTLLTGEGTKSWQLNSLPSPDGKKLAVRMDKEVLIFDDAGKILTKVDVGD